jgi:hypothetical protein
MKRQAGWVVTVLAAGVVGGCHGPTGSSHVETADVAKTYTVGATLGANPPAAEVRFSLPSAPVVGRGFRLDAVMVFARAVPDAQVEVVGDEGLSIVSPTGAQHLQRLESGARVPLGIEASAETPGTHLITVRTTSEGASADLADAVIFPVVVGTLPAGN